MFASPTSYLRVLALALGSLVVSVPAASAAIDVKYVFQPSTAAVPAGYLADDGSPYSSVTGRGWVTEGSISATTHASADLTAWTRLRTGSGTAIDKRVIHTQPTTALKGAFEVSVPNGNYTVKVQMGDVGYVNSVYAAHVEGKTIVAPYTPTTAAPSTTGTTTVAVTDGRLTFDTIGGTNAKFNAIEIKDAPASTPTPSPTPTPTTPAGLLSTKVDFMPPGDVPAGYVAETGGAYSDTRGRGFVTQASLSSASHTPIDVSERMRARGTTQDPRVDTLVVLDSSTSLPTAAWERAVPNGTYTVTIGVGDPSYFNSRYIVNAEGVQVIDATPLSAPTKRSFSATVRGIPVTDGRLTIDGINGTNVKLEYVDIVQTSATATPTPPATPTPTDTPTPTATPTDTPSPTPTTTPDPTPVPPDTPTPTPGPSYDRSFNFQPANVPTVAGYDVESGQAYSSTRGYGWIRQSTVGLPNSQHAAYDMTANTRDRNKITDQRLDTLIQMQPASGDTTKGAWELALPDGTYEVTLSVGDAGYVDSSHTINVEGRHLLDGMTQTTSNLFTTRTIAVEVTDGRLTIDAAGGVNTKLNYVRVKSVADGSGTAGLRVESTQAAAFPDQVALTRFEALPNGWPATIAHDTADVRIRNNGPTTLKIGSVASTSTNFQVTVPGQTLPVTLSPGDAVTARVKFVYADPSRRLVVGEHEQLKGELVVGLASPSTAFVRISLRGFWQSRPERATEPTLSQIVNDEFGFGTVITGPGQSLRNNGAVQAVGDEVISAYWSRVDASSPVHVTQLAAYHGSGNTEILSWMERGADKFDLHEVGTHIATDAQTLLPNSVVDGNTLSVDFTPATDAFGFKSTSAQTGEWSDPAFNDTTVDLQNGCSGACGQHMRFWPAKTRTGATIPGAYLMGMDYGSAESVNYDFQDNVYLISNITPATP